MNKTSKVSEMQLSPKHEPCFSKYFFYGKRVSSFDIVITLSQTFFEPREDDDGFRTKVILLFRILPLNVIPFLTGTLKYPQVFK